jgi:hypothetical protein
VAKKKTKPKRKPKGTRTTAPRTLREDEPVSLHPLKFTEAMAVLLGAKRE